MTAGGANKEGQRLWDERKRKARSSKPKKGKNLSQNDSLGFEPETPCLVQNQQAVKPLQHFALCDKLGRQTVNRVAVSHKQNKKKAPAHRRQRRRRTPDKCDSGVTAFFAIIAGKDATILPTSVKEDGLKKRPNATIATGNGE